MLDHGPSHVEDTANVHYAAMLGARLGKRYAHNPRALATRFQVPIRYIDDYPPGRQLTEVVLGLCFDGAVYIRRGIKEKATIARALGHLFTHSGVGVVREPGALNSSEEQEADAFAAAFLADDQVAGHQAGGHHHVG